MATTPLFEELEDLRHKWGWLFALGIGLVLLGTIALFITPAATIGHRAGTGLVDGNQRRHRSRACISSAGMGRRVPASDWRSARCAGRLTDRHPPRRRRTRVDATLCLILHRHRDVSSDHGDQVKVPQLGMGSFRRGCDAPARDSTLRRLPLVGVLVFGSGGGGLVNPARLVLCNVRDGCSQFACPDSHT